MRDLLLDLHHGKISQEFFRSNFYKAYVDDKARPIQDDKIFYSYRKNDSDAINEHEIKRLRHSISSIRKFNTTIPVYIFCNDPLLFPKEFEDKLDVVIMPSIPFDYNMLNAWSIHRWYNLQHFWYQDCNLLYVDNDTIFYSDPKYLFETYTQYSVYGREEKGFRHCPEEGSSKDIRFHLDLVDACIKAEGGKVPVHKYCIGAILLNHNIHKEICNNLHHLTRIMNGLKEKKVLNPIPNPRILDEYGIWILLSTIAASNGLFGIQDVTHGWVENKHKDNFHPVLLHYTTKDEQEFVNDNKPYWNLRRDVDNMDETIDPHIVK